MMYQADIVERKGSSGHFLVKLRGSQWARLRFDPEHDLCFAMVKLGYPDGPIQFYHKGVPSLSHSSIHAMAKRHISMGNRFPHERRKRHSGYAHPNAGGQNDGG